jgi:hypothetical protein
LYSSKIEIIFHTRKFRNFYIIDKTEIMIL